MYATPADQTIRRAHRHLKQGGVLAYATESCLGFGCHPNHYRGLRTLIRLKKRPQTKGMILIAANLAQAQPYLAPLSPVAYQTLEADFAAATRPTTFLLPAARHVLPILRGRHSTVAVRVTRHGDAAQLCRALGHALVSTSANLSGKKALTTQKQLKKCFASALKKQKLMLIKGRIGTEKKPSSLIDYASKRILR
ncbi:MAG: L-threonylcarbamoyladenylate synthase [Neisseriaceae bacterium]|nr:L-threonylcarbamoyladenylate synthase [Neisseriaceae bacterium]